MQHLETALFSHCDKHRRSSSSCDPAVIFYKTHSTQNEAQELESWWTLSWTWAPYFPAQLQGCMKNFDFESLVLEVGSPAGQDTPLSFPELVEFLALVASVADTHRV
ncbi:hypothetical protein RRG08_032073 [Elysia crispata]|uniref:Uncharacterized protein n=1 Tax=Elysia crispata TaxID=231223 RepID=A0AAE1DFX9_9GAST|nr:hypothetical protein RRG08_032073 [Elysia crispata]